jgi:hypothetical protein
MPGTNNPVFTGQAAGFEIHLINSRDSERPNIKLQISKLTSATTDLNNNSRDSIKLFQESKVRGLLCLERVTVSTNYPLGLLRAWSYVDLASDCLIYPEPASRRPPATNSDYDHSYSGDKGVGVDDFVTTALLQENGTHAVQMTFMDTGPGICDENPSNIFLPFYSTKQGSENNLGLGLSVSYGIIQKYNGTIAVKNIDNTGCQFVITLPQST